MTQIENARRARAGAGILKAGEHFGNQHTNTDPETQYQPCADERTRCLAEPGLIADRLQAYAALDPEIVRALGAGSFPPMPLGVVP